MDYTRISADCHIDMPWIPPDLFTANASAAMRERMPYVTDGPDGPCWSAKNGASFGLVGGVGPGGAEVRAGPALPRRRDGGDRPLRRRQEGDPPPDRSALCASRTWSATACRPRSSSASSARPRGCAITRRPTRCSASTTTGSWTSAATTRRGRSAWPACPTATSSAAVNEIHRVAKMGLRGLELSCSWDMEPMWHPSWEPLWQAVNEVDLPLHFHTFPTHAAQRAGEGHRPHAPRRHVHRASPASR